MGWETGVSLGATGVGAIAGINNAEAQTKAIAQSAEYTASNIANKTARTEGTLETSFLKGGIALTGAGGTSAVFQQAGAQGITDISRTIDNANASISNTMNAARTGALNSIAGGFGKLGSGVIAGALDQAYSGSWLQSAWNGITGNPDPSPQGTGNNVGTYMSTATVGGGTAQ